MPSAYRRSRRRAGFVGAAGPRDRAVPHGQAGGSGARLGRHVDRGSVGLAEHDVLLAVGGRGDAGQGSALGDGLGLVGAGGVDDFLDLALALVVGAVDAHAVGGDPGEDDPVLVERGVEQIGVVLGEFVVGLAVLLTEPADGDAERGRSTVPGDGVAVGDGVDVCADLRGLLVDAAAHLVGGQDVGAEGGAVVRAALALPAVLDAVRVEGGGDLRPVAVGDLQGQRAPPTTVEL
ncbi:hypothetical protein [Streptomyces sp. PanSC19]|uniref:hypothetical protein n=1 Tax=Streptomyces sp. PanSC19 TaxID=1520455 RepID=UPI0011CD59AF|nr:hypothetical protein [Streptomyces sp. PanSC19]